MKVVNDIAEISIAVLKSFALCVKEQGQFQWVLQTVEQHSRKIRLLTKAALTKCAVKWKLDA